MTTTMLPSDMNERDTGIGTVTPLERAKRLAPLLERGADETESLATMPASVVDAIDAEGLFGLLLPPDLGGLGGDVLDALEVTEELSRADGSAGWTFMANSTIAAHYAAQCGAGALDTLFRSPIRPIMAGQMAPLGNMIPADGGFRVQGSYSFGSGAGHASWIASGARFVNENGEAEELAFLVARENVVFKGNWDVLGLVGTGSYDYEVPEQFVPSDLIVRRIGGRAKRGHATLRLNLFVLGSAGHAGVALGIAKRALQELANIVAAGKQRPNVTPIAQQQLFLHDLALHEGRLAACRALCVEAFAEALATVAAGGETQTEQQYQRIRQATTLTTTVAAEVVEFAYAWSGSKGLRHPHPLGRCMRDMHAATQHIYVDPSTLVNAAPHLIEAHRRA